MGFRLYFRVLLAEDPLIIIALDFVLEAELPPALDYIIKQLKYDLVCSPSAWIGIATRNLRNNSRIPNKSNRETKQIGDGCGLFKESATKQVPGKQASHFLLPNSSRLCFPYAPKSKGYLCPIHKGSIVNCATFFENRNYEYKLLCRGELFFRLKGAHTFRTGPVVPKEPGNLFIVKLDRLDLVTFCFDLSSRTLGEVNGRAEFLPVQTSVASSQEAHGLVYTQGKGCAFDWVYGNRSSLQYPWDYHRRYDVGWMHSSPATEELFAANDTLLSECCPLVANSVSPLKHSPSGLDSVENFPSSNALGEIHVGFAHIELNATGTQVANNTQLPPSSSSHATLPHPLTPASQSRAPVSIATPVTNKSVLRRTCSICNRVLRRPSALTIHMNSHLGVKRPRVIFLPKYHCELNPIEQCWGYAKRKYRQMPPTNKESVMVKYIIGALDSIPIESIRRFAARSQRFVDAYASGNNGEKAIE